MLEGLRNFGLIFSALSCSICGVFALATGKKSFAVVGVLYVLALIMVVTLS